MLPQHPTQARQHVAGRGARLAVIDLLRLRNRTFSRSAILLEHPSDGGGGQVEAGAGEGPGDPGFAQGGTEDLEALIGRMRLKAQIIRRSLSIYANRPSLLIYFDGEKTAANERTE